MAATAARAAARATGLLRSTRSVVWVARVAVRVVGTRWTAPPVAYAPSILVRDVWHAPVLGAAPRGMAKKAGKGGGKDADNDSGKVDLRSFDLKALDANIRKSTEQLNADLRVLRVGAANPNWVSIYDNAFWCQPAVVQSDLLDKVTVMMPDGKPTPLAQVAQVSVRDGQALWVAIFDPQLLEPAATAIRNAGLGLNPITDKNALRVPIPKIYTMPAAFGKRDSVGDVARMTTEHRDNLVKLVAKEAEKARAAVRNHRQTILKDLKRVSDGASQDEVKRLEKAIQKSVDDGNKVIDQLVKAKTTEIQQR